MGSAVAGGHVDEGRSSTDLIGHSGDDSDSDSDQKWKSWVKSQFWYELPMSNDVPDYRELPYPWEAAAEKEKASGSGKEEEEQGAFFLKVTDITWSGLSADERKRGRWESHGKELTDIMQPDLLSDEQRNDASFSSQSQVGDLDAEQQPLCSSTEVLDVRMEMHECFEQGISYRHLFESKANRDELSFHSASDEPYRFNVNCSQRELNMPSYPHVFPELHGTDPMISCKWLRPTTFEGDEQYLQFFPLLVQATEYGETKDHVLAKAIVIARKSFQKMLRFQIDIAVEDRMDFLRIDEAMKRRYNLYYFAVSEIILNGKDFESVVKSIRNGDSGLPYGLTEFGSSTYLCKAKSSEIVHHLVEHFRSERKCGKYKEWSCKKADVEVAQIVCDTVDELVPSPCHLYLQFLWKKMRTAQELGLVCPFVYRKHNDVTQSECIKLTPFCI